MEEPANEWQDRLRPERPVYVCPKCNQPAMQFFAERADMPGRHDFYYCCACGSTWEV